MSNKHEPNGYSFECGGNAVIVDGKIHWRDCIVVWFDRQRALQIIQSIASQLENKDAESISISMCGWIEKVEDGHWPF